MNQATSILTALLLAAAAAVAAGCGSTPNAPFMAPSGLLFSYVKAPLQTEFTTPARVSPGRESRSTFYIHDRFLTRMDYAWGDCSLATAARKSGLRRVEYADYTDLQILGLFGYMSVTAHGSREPFPLSATPPAGAETGPNTGRTP